MLKIIRNFLFLVPSKINFVICCGVIFVGGILEILGISLIIPFLDNISGKSNVNFYKVLLSDASNYLKLDLTLLIFILFLFYYFFRTIYLILANYIQYNYINQAQLRTSNRLYAQYVDQPYEFHLNNNSSSAIRDLTSDINSFSNLLTNIISFFNDLFFIILIFLFLFFIYSFKIIIFFIFILLLGYIVVKLIKNYNLKWGKSRNLAEQVKIKIIQQGLGAIKEIKILNKENFFLEIFYNSQKKASSIQFKQNFFQSLPKVILEFLGIFVLFTFIFLNLKLYNITFVDSIPSIAVFLVILIKILPSFSRLLASVQNIYYYSSCLDNLNKFQNAINAKEIIAKTVFKNTSKKFNLCNFIHIKNLSFSYFGNNKFILKNFTHKIFQKRLTVIYGPSGTGKSTLINLLIGVLRPQNGGIYLNGKRNIFTSDTLLKQWRSAIGYVPQNIFILDDTIVKNIAFGVPENEIDIKKINKIIKLIELENFVGQTKDGIYSVIGENGKKLSGGQKQRIGIGRALYRMTKILILDEATNSLDSETEKSIIRNIKKIKLIKFIIMVSHKKEIINISDTKIKIH